MNLRDILNLDYFNGLDAQQCLDSGNIVGYIGSDNTRYTYAGVGEIFHSNDIDTSILLDIPGWVKSLTGGASLDAFLMVGCDFSNPGIQHYLIVNTGIRSGEIDQKALETLIHTGIKVGTTWDKYSVPTPTIETISGALQQISVEKAKTNFTNKYTTIMNKFENGEVTTLNDAIYMMSNI